MFKKLLLLIAILISYGNLANSATGGDWKLYPTFDNYFSNVIDTDNHVYVLAYSQLYNTSVSQYAQPYATLFVYDKSSDEFMSYNRRNYLTDNMITRIDYNTQRGYLLIVYQDCNIDLLFDDGHVVNIPGLKNVTMTVDKSVNDVTFDAKNKLAYLATTFGFVAIDDEKGEISVSRNYSTSLNSVGRVGDYFVILNGNNNYISPISSPHLSLNDFSALTTEAGATLSTMQRLLPLSDNKLGYITNGYLYTAEMTADGKLASITNLNLNSINTINTFKDGYLMSCSWAAIKLNPDCTTKIIGIPSENQGDLFSTTNLQDFWFVTPRKGISSKKLAEDNTTWTITRQASMPNSPTTFICQGMAYSPKYGTIMVNHGTTMQLTDYGQKTPNLLCGLKDGEWHRYGPVYTNPTYATALNYPKGLGVDPDNPAYVYHGSFLNGIIRLNLDDPNDVLHMTHPSDPASSLPSYQKLVDDDSWAVYCGFSGVSFDSKGNMWSLHHSFSGHNNVWVWPAEDRRKGNVSGWTSFNVDGMSRIEATGLIWTLKSTGRDMLAISTAVWGDALYIVDLNGTPTDPSDDIVASLGQLYDQDGNSITKNYIYEVYEDTSTGTVWVGTSDGLFTFNLKNIFSNPTTVRRVKVARNDGTNLADYLLDGIPVFKIIADGNGNKWFATDGGGLVQTSSDGTYVMRQFTSDNSYLPNNTVYDICYNPETNSIMASTLNGIAEYFLPGSSSGTNFDRVKAYPNPVRPDYLGWITIEGLEDNALVKIVDASGNLVRELGHSEGGSIQWDGTNMSNVKVNSGVYYVFMSSASEDNSGSNVTKILIVK